MAPDLPRSAVGRLRADPDRVEAQAVLEQLPAGGKSPSRTSTERRTITSPATGGALDQILPQPTGGGEPEAAAPGAFDFGAARRSCDSPGRGRVAVARLVLGSRLGPDPPGRLNPWGRPPDEEAIAAVRSGDRPLRPRQHRLLRSLAQADDQAIRSRTSATCCPPELPSPLSPVPQRYRSARSPDAICIPPKHSPNYRLLVSLAFRSVACCIRIPTNLTGSRTLPTARRGPVIETPDEDSVSMKLVW
jgi:hypothetical protein